MERGVLTNQTGENVDTVVANLCQSNIEIGSLVKIIESYLLRQNVIRA